MMHPCPAMSFYFFLLLLGGVSSAGTPATAARPPSMIDVSNNTSSNPSAGGNGAPQPSSSSSTSSPTPSSHQVSPAQVYINHLVAEISQSISYKNTGKKSGTASELQGIFPWGSMTHIPPNPIVENGRKSPKASALYLQENDFYRKTVHFWVPDFICQSHFTCYYYCCC